MANSGSFNTSTASGMYLNFSWSLASQSVSGNYSDINFTLTGQGGSAGYYVVSGPFRLNVSGQDFNREERINLYPGTTVITGSKRIYHDSSGNASFGASCNAAIYSYALNVSGSDGWSLPNIPRQANITSAPDFNDEGNPTITYSNPAGNTVSSLQACISLNGSNDDVPYRDISKTGSSYTFNLTEEERNTLRNATPNSNTLNVFFYVRTILSGNTYYSRSYKTMTIINANPIIESVYPGYKDVNPVTKALTSDTTSLFADAVVRGYSNLQVDIYPSEAQKGAEMVKYRVKIGSVETEVAYSNEDLQVQLNNVDDSILNIYSIDSRGNSSLDSKVIPRYIQYKSLNEYAHIAELTRSAIQNQNVNLNLTGNYWNSDFSTIRTNTIQSITYQYKKTEGDTWHDGETEITFSIDDDEYSFEGLIKGDLGANGFSAEYSFLLKFTITDYLSAYEFQVILSKASPNIAVHRLGTSFGSPYDETEGGIVQLKGTNIYKMFNRFETVLYEDTSGTGTIGNVMLSDSVTNYDEILIFMRRETNKTRGWDYDIYQEYLIHEPNYKIVPLALIFADINGSIIQTSSKVIQIEDDLISVLTQQAANTGASSTSSINLYIYKVLGYKKVEE